MRILLIAAAVLAAILLFLLTSASANTTPTGTFSAIACRICPKAISGLV